MNNTIKLEGFAPKKIIVVTDVTTYERQAFEYSVETLDALAEMDTVQIEVMVLNKQGGEK